MVKQLNMMIDLARERRLVSGLHHAVVQRGQHGERFEVVQHRRHLQRPLLGVMWSTYYEAQRNAYLSANLSGRSD